MKLPLAVALLLCPIGVWAQAGNTLTLQFPGVPTGGCVFLMLARNNANSDIYACKVDGTWQKIGPGGPGSGITELTGDVTAGPGSGSQAATIAVDSVTNAKLANVASATVKGRNTAGTGDPEDLTTLPIVVQDNITRVGTVTLGSFPFGNLTGVPSTLVKTDQTNSYTTGTQDFESAAITRPFRRLAFASFPGTCVANREFLERSDPATAGQVIYVCNATGTGWDLVGDGAASGSGYNTAAILGPGGAQPPATDLTQRTKLLFQYPLVGIDNSGSSRTDISLNGPGCDPRKFACYFEDFISGHTSASLYMGALGWTTTDGTLDDVSQNDTGFFGEKTLTTGAATNNAANIFLPQRTINYAATTFDVMVRFDINSTTSVASFVGLASANNNGELNDDYIGVAYNTGQSDTNFMCVTRSGAGTPTRTSMGVTADTSLHTARIRSTTAGTVLCSIDGGSETSVATTVPTVRLTSFESIITLTTAARVMKLDFVWHVAAIAR